MKKMFLLLALFALVMSSCIIRVGDSTKDNDEKITKTFDLADFSEIGVVGAADIDFVQDSIYKVEVEASQKVFDYLKLEVKDSILVVRNDDANHFSQKKIVFHKLGGVKLTVHAPNLNAVKIAGSGDFNTSKLVKHGTLRLDIAGSGDMDFDHLETDTLLVAIAGSGDMDFNLHNVAYSSFTIAGSGDIDAKMTNCGIVRKNIAGSGDINLSGDYKLE